MSHSSYTGIDLITGIDLWNIREVICQMMVMVINDRSRIQNTTSNIYLIFNIRTTCLIWNKGMLYLRSSR